jgi:hypothetical protein
MEDVNYTCFKTKYLGKCLDLRRLKEVSILFILDGEAENMYEVLMGTCLGKDTLGRQKGLENNI